MAYPIAIYFFFAIVTGAIFTVAALRHELEMGQEDAVLIGIITGIFFPIVWLVVVFLSTAELLDFIVPGGEDD